MSKVILFSNLSSTPRNTLAKTSQKKPFLSLKNVSISSITIEAETSLVKNWSTPSELSVLNIKLNKSSVSSQLHLHLKKWTLAPSLKSSDSAVMETAKPQLLNSSNTLISTNKEPSVLKNSKRSQPALDKTSQLLKLTKWSIMLIKTETESLALKNSSTSSTKNTQKSEMIFYGLSF